MFGHLIPDHWSRAIAINFSHRVGALLVSGATLALFAYVRTHYRDHRELVRPTALIVALVAVQIMLGALTILSRRDPWINSFHVVCGALVLTTSLVITLRSWRSRFADYEQREPLRSAGRQRDQGDLMPAASASAAGRRGGARA
jgi:heme A synthase